VPTGLAMCVVAQQLGWTPLTPQWMVTWTIIPTALGGVVQGGLSSLIGATASRGQSSHPWEDSVSEGTAAEPAPPPPPPTAPPPNAPVPGPPSAGAPTPAREAPP